jgi:hypothetical protein
MAGIFRTARSGKIFGMMIAALCIGAIGNGGALARSRGGGDDDGTAVRPSLAPTSPGFTVEDLARRRYGADLAPAPDPIVTGKYAGDEREQIGFSGTPDLSQHPDRWAEPANPARDAPY